MDTPYASPVSHVSKITAPVQIFHGEEDTIEPVTKVRNFVHELDKYNKSYELWTYRVMNFLRMYLGNR